MKSFVADLFIFQPLLLKYLFWVSDWELGSNFSIK